MTLKGKFIRHDVFTGRRQMGPLGWILVFVATLFVLACVLGSYQLLTHNVTRLEQTQAYEGSGQTQGTGSGSISIQAAGAGAVTDSTVGAGKLQATGETTAARGVTWTVWSAQDPLGQPIFEGSSEIKVAVLRDYRAAQEWLNANLLDKDTLLQHLDEYYTDKALTDGRRNIERAFGEAHVIMAPSIAQPRQPAPMDQPRFVTFSQDGRQVRVNDYTAAGPARQFDTRTRRLVPVNFKTGFVWQYLLAYDPNARRWKIARNTQVINAETNALVFSDEP